MTRLEKLKDLEAFLKACIYSVDDARNVAQIAKQYRETLKEIEEIEGEATIDDDIGKLLREREADGKSRTVRKNRSGV